VPPDAVDVAAMSSDGASSADATSDGPVPDSTPTADCGTLVTFHVIPDVAVDPDTLCPMDCGGPLATLASGSVQLRASYWLSPSTPVVWVTPYKINSCAVSCETCQTIFCHSCIVTTEFPPSGFSPSWDGSYFLQGTCNGNVCMGPTACVATGRYTATFCVQKGITTKTRLGGACLPLGKLDPSQMQATACGSVDFEIPSTASLPVKVGGTVGTRVPLDPAIASALLDLVGDYRLNPSSGSIGVDTGAAKLEFANVDLAVAAATDSDLLVVTNPLPGEFPDSCEIPLNVAIDGTGRWSLENPAVTCTKGTATITLYPGYYRLSASERDLAIAAAGAVAGGTRSGDQTFAFAYSGLAQRL
jgi:hypothetical protein